MKRNFDEGERIARRAPFVLTFGLMLGVSVSMGRLNVGQDVTLLPISLAQVLGLVAPIALLAGRISIRLPAKYIVVAVLLVSIGAAFHIVGGPERALALRYVLRWLGFLGLVISFKQVHAVQGGSVAITSGLLIGGLLNLATCLAHKYGLPAPTYALSGHRYAGLFAHPNQYGIYCSVASYYLIGRVFSGGGKERVLAAAAFCGMLGGCFFSISKTNTALIGALLMASAFFALISGSFKFRLWSGVAVTLSAFLVFISASAAIQYLEVNFQREYAIVTEAIYSKTDTDSFQGRLHVWEEALVLARDNMVFGRGPGMFSDELPYEHAHNLLLQLWLEAGLFGLAGVLILGIGTALVATSRAIDWIRARTSQGSGELIIACGPIVYVFANAMSDSMSGNTLPVFAMVLAVSCQGGERHLERRHSVPNRR